MSSESERQSIEGVYNQIRDDGKTPPRISTPVFFATVFFGIPLWLTVLLPLSVCYQIAKAVLRGGRDDTVVATIPPGDEVFPSVSELKPLEKRKFDVVLLGATGFTGRLTALYLARTYGVGGAVKWALAGRSKEKLDMLKQDLANELGNNDVMRIDTRIVDTSIRSSLHKLVNDSRVVVTTAGPFSEYGSPVVEFCAKYGTNYIDITGDIDWVKEMITKWDETAQRTGAKIISVCGNGSVPWDLSVHKLSQLMKNRCKDELVEVQLFEEIRASVSGGTIASGLLRLEGKKKSSKYTFNPLLKKPDGSKSKFRTKVRNPVFIAPCRNYRFGSTWAAPFPLAAVNAQVVARSRALKNEGSQTLIYREAKLCADFKTAFADFFSLIVGVTALLNPVTGKPLKRFVLPRPGEGPSAETMDKGYLCVSGFGIGSKGSKVESVMYFPNDPGYRDTGRMIVESALCLSVDAKKLPVTGGGFFTPASGMGDVLLDRLCRTGTKFASSVVMNE